MIEVSNLTKVFGTHLAVDSISFEARPGEVVGILGPNGAGKTTTMRMLTGFMPPTSGEAKVAGFDIFRDSLEVRRHVGYLPETVPVYPDMTVYGYIKFWAELRGMRRARRRVEEVIEQVGLQDRRRSLIRNLSKGMRQRLGLAQAIVHNPDVIILDEPTIGIDPQQVIEVRESVRALGENHTVLFSTHILSEAEQVCDRVLIIHQGRIVAEGAPANLRSKLQPHPRLYVVIGGTTPENALQLLRQIDGVESVIPQGEGFILQTQTGQDIRAAVSAHVTHSGCQLLELRPVAMTLEDIFLDIVGRPH
ncbi:MAG TPA: ABC transporter ATP-binding protein [Spirillospora sp.]|nr:ABC transporter ATP-binding protein [Spirillospora sp.]